MSDPNKTVAPVTPHPSHTARLASLDAFRGLDIALMFLVNLSANRDAFPEWFEHAGWNGGRHGQGLADYVFPWFLFIVGVAVPFSMTGGRGKLQTPGRRVIGALRRGAILYFLGVLIWMAKTANDGVGWVDGRFVARPGTPITWGTLLHWDILPLIGLGYLLCVVVYHAPRWAQVSFVVAVLGTKWLALQDLATTAGMERAQWMAARIDLDHAVRQIGWFGTAITQGLPAAVTVVLGMWAGQWLRSSGNSPAAKSVVLGVAGAMVTVAALLAAAALRCPISKDFFTTSYVMLSAGTAAMTLAGLYWVLDVRAVPRWVVRLSLGAVCLLAAGLSRALRGAEWMPDSPADAIFFLSLAVGVVMLIGAMWDLTRHRQEPGRLLPLVILGSNAIALYVAAELAWTLVWMHWRVQSPGGFGAQAAFASLQLHWRFALENLGCREGLARGLGPWLATITYTAIYLLLSWWLWNKRWFVRV